MDIKCCPDCGVSPGLYHSSGCDVEPCPICGHQALSCDCEWNDSTKRIPWTGIWPGKIECQEFGWYTKMVEGIGWVSCDKDDPEASEDLNRLHTDATWDAERQRWVKKAFIREG